MRLLREVRALLGNYQLKSGIYHHERGESSQAIEYLTRALQDTQSSESDRSTAVYYLTQAHIAAAEGAEEAGQVDRAIAAYRQSLTLTPEYPDIHFRLAVLCERFDLTSDALEAYRSALAINPGYVEARVRLAFLLLRDARRDEARAEFTAARDHAARAIDEPFQQGAAALEAGDARLAGEFMRAAFLFRPESFDLHFRRGLRSLREGSFEPAIEDLRQAIALRSDFADVHNYLGVACGEADQWEDAITAFRSALEAHPDYAIARLNLAFALARAGREGEAGEELRAILAREPDNLPAASKLEELTAPRRDKIRTQGGP